MARAFIAAPLMGTLIFLSAVVFVVHMTQTEKAEVSGIVSDIYHNRIITMLEDYRYDMSSLFSVSLGRSIEKYLSSECWEVFAVENKNLIDDRTLATELAPNGFPEVLRDYYDDKEQFNYDDIPFCNNKNRDRNAAGPTCKPDSTSPVASRNFPGQDSSASNYNPVCVENCNGQLDYHELRYAKCTEITRIIKQGICPYDVKFGFSAWLNATRAPFSFEGVSFALSNPDLVKGLVGRSACEFENGQIAVEGFQHLDDLREGEACIPQPTCKLEDGAPCPQRAAGGGPLVGKLRLARNIEKCSQLVGETLFDCRNFAENLNKPFRCCDKFYFNENNPGDKFNGICCSAEIPAGQRAAGRCDADDHVLEGCEQGGFFVRVNVRASEEIFRSLPRVNASDKAGNQIQSGALGDKPFEVHVKYPVYKYLDAAFRLYAPVAYGVGADEDDFKAPTANMRKHKGKSGEVEDETGARRPARQSRKAGDKPQDEEEGVIEGVCYGENCNEWVKGTPLVRYKSRQFKRNAQPLAAGGQTQPVKPIDQQITQAATTPSQANNPRRIALEHFLDTFFIPGGKTPRTDVCRLFEPPVCNAYKLCNTLVSLSGPGLERPMVLCSNNPTQSQALQIKNRLISPSQGGFTRLVDSENCGVKGGTQKTCAAIDNLRFTIEFKDSQPETLVNPEANRFCWHLRPTFADPQQRAGDPQATATPRPGIDTQVGPPTGQQTCAPSQECRRGTTQLCTCPTGKSCRSLPSGDFCV